MENNERSASKQFLSKIEEGQAKLYFDIGKRIHSYFEESLSETKQYIELLTPQEMDANIDDSAKYLELLQNYELLQKDIQKLKHTNEKQQTKIQDLIEENDRLSMATRTSLKKVIENNETDDSTHTDQPKTTTKKPRKPKTTKTVKKLTVTNATDKDQSGNSVHEEMDLFNEQNQNGNEENSE